MDYSTYFALEKKLKSMGYQLERHEVVAEMTRGRKKGLSDLTHTEYTTLIAHMRTVAAKSEDPAMNRMRKKIIAIFRKMGYEQFDKANMKRIYSWVRQYGLYHKHLYQHSKGELTRLVSQVEAMYQSFLNEIHKNP